MSVAQQQTLTLGLICLFTAAVLAGILALTRVSRFGVFAVANLLLGAGAFGAQAAFGFSGWRSEIVSASAVELPAVFLISWVCLAQAGGFGNRLNSTPSEPVVRHPRLRKVLGMAPVVLLACWIFAVVVGLLWPSPAMQPYTSAPAQFLLFKWPISIPQMIYASLAATVFAMSAMSRASASVLRLRNTAFSVSMALLALIAAESALFASVRFWEEGQRRREIIDLLLFFETLFAVGCFVALAVGLALRYTPTVAAAVLARVHTAWLPARERLESSGWQAMAGGRTRGVTRLVYRVEEAARLLGLPGSDTERAIAAIHLLAVVQDPSTEKGAITPSAARELYDIEQEILSDEALAAKIRSSLQRRKVKLARQPLYAAPLQDALKAALDLIDKQTDEADTRPLWFYLVAAASADAGLIDGHGMGERFGDRDKGSVAAKAYQAAKLRLRSQVFSKP